jgi:hypothetical protein
MLTRPGTRPSTFMVAGSAMMPAPTIVVDRLKTAPGKEAPLNSWNAASSSPSAAAAGPSRFVGSSGSLGSAAPPMVIFEKNSGGFLWSTDYSFSFEKKRRERKAIFLQSLDFLHQQLVPLLLQRRVGDSYAPSPKNSTQSAGMQAQTPTTRPRKKEQKSENLTEQNRDTANQATSRRLVSIGSV